MICSNCSAENDAGAKFCNECGNPLSAGCPNCGATNKPGAKFCNECGTPLSGAVTRPATAAGNVAVPEARAPGAVAERRLVTVLFADLVGFTPFAAERDAEEVRETLSRYFDMCSEIVGRYGGTIEKFIGDAVMAVWGAPTAHEDDAERAVRAALDLVSAVKQIAPNVQARAGVLTGEAAVTVGAANQGMVAGDMVNTASRLQSVAPAGTVLVGDATYRAASRAIQFEEAGPQLLKGKEAPVTAWRAVRIVAERGGRNRQSEGLEAPFVGRDDELQLLKDLLHATGREKRVRLISVMGPGGIGKSRLAWEFSKYIDGLVEPIFWHSGRSPAYGEGVTFWALGEMVRGRAGLAETDDEATTRQKIAATVGEFVTDEEQRDRVEQAILALLGVQSGLPSDQLFGAWRSFFENVSSQGTVVLAFEDNHHADSGLLDFIDHMLDFSRGYPIYILALARPELLDRRQDWGAGKRNFTSVYLDPLPDSQMRELLGGLVPGLPDEAVQLIVERADGIPLYAVETVRMLVADGRLNEERGVYVPVGDLTSLAVPESLTALIASRLDTLEATDRSLVHDAAVLGQSFTLEALASVAGRAPAEVELALKGLIRRELLRRELDERSAEVGQYAFMQSLIREVAYNTLSRKDRKARHLAAARYFEQVGSDELASALAGHYVAAQQNAPEGAEADALAAQARVALKGAAERAAALGAYDQALRFIEQSIEITVEPGELVELRQRAGTVASRGLRTDRAQSHLRAAIDLGRDLGDRVAVARASAQLAMALLDARENTAALEIVEPATTEFADIDDDLVLVNLNLAYARALGQRDRYRDAIEIANYVLELAERHGWLEQIATGFLPKAAALNALGRMREAIALANAARDIARAGGYDHLLATALGISSFLYAEIDQRAALAAAREALELAKRLGLRDRLQLAITNYSYSAFLVGDWDAAQTELGTALSEFTDAGPRIWLLSNSLVVQACRGDDVSEGLLELGELVERAGEPELAGAALDATAHAAFAAGDLSTAARDWAEIARVVPGQATSGHYQVARCALWADDLEQVTVQRDAIDASGFHGGVVEVRRRTVEAGVAALEGRTNEALRLYRDAIAGWKDLGMAWDEALTGIDAVVALGPSSAPVREIAESTRLILNRLGARPFLARLNAALDREPGSVQATDVARQAAGDAVTVESR